MLTEYTNREAVASHSVLELAQVACQAEFFMQVLTHGRDCEGRHAPGNEVKATLNDL